MKLINIVSVCTLLMVGLSAFAEGEVKKQEATTSKGSIISRGLNLISLRKKAHSKKDEVSQEAAVTQSPAVDQKSKPVIEQDKDSESSSSTSSDTSSDSSTKSWSSESATWESWDSWSSASSSSSSSDSSEDDSTDDSSDSTDSSTSPDSSSEKISTKVEPTGPHLQYDYIDDAFIKHVIASKFRYVLVATGWSETSLGKMNLNNQEKQMRAFALSYAQMIKIERQGGLGRLIYLTTADISPFYRRYLYRVGNKPTFTRLREADIELKFRTFEKHSLRVVYFSPKGRERDAENITAYLSEKSNRFRQIKLPKALNALRNDLFVSNHFVGFTAHFSGPFLEDLAKKWDLPYLVNPSAQAHWIKKSKSRQSFRDAHVRHPRGTYEPSFSVDALVDDIYALLKQLDYKKIILKLDQSAAGYGNKVMKFDEITDDLTEKEAKMLIRKRFNDREIFPDFFIRRIEEEDGGAIIEEFIDCKNYASPASIYMINGHHDINMRYTYDQLLGGKDNQVFQGSIGPIQVNQNYPDGDLIAMSRAIGMTLSEQGVRGNVGTDFVTCDADNSDNPNRDAWAIENNVRMTGTSYPYYTMMTLVGADKIKSKFMKSFDDVKIPTIAYSEFRKRIQREFYLSFLLKHPDTLDIRTARGCLIHNNTFRIGKLGVACLADSRQEVSEMYDRFIASVYKFVDEHEATYEYRKFVKLSEVENLKVALNNAQKTLEKLVDKDDLPKKKFDTIYDGRTFVNDSSIDDGQTRKKMKPETHERNFQQKFFNEFVFTHPAYFNPKSGTGCIINNDVFKQKQVGMVCMWEDGEKPASYGAFFEEIKQKLFAEDYNEEEDPLN